jgi:acyl-CoA reductase-like NAD-dependent aldehyde dehydrogenase
VEEDSRWEEAADKAAIHGFTHAGQSCISTQRIIVHERIAEAFTERLLAGVGRLKVGDPLEEATDVGPLIDDANRDRVKGWIQDAANAGARVLSGGEVNEDGTLQPTVIQDPPRTANVWCSEVFGPLVTLTRYSSLEEAIALANDSPLALQAGIYTRDIGVALRAARELRFGGVLINEVPTYRADQQPYGGVKDSGNAREGPAYAIRELTEERFIALW